MTDDKSDSNHRLTIVVVDDEMLIADTLAFILDDAGYRVFTASNGKAALEKITAVGPDLVITDFMMPAMSGLELALALKRDPRFQSMPIILASAAQGAIARQHNALFAAVFDKPYSPFSLLETVERLIGPPSAEPTSQ